MLAVMRLIASALMVLKDPPLASSAGPRRSGHLTGSAVGSGSLLSVGSASLRPPAALSHTDGSASWPSHA